MGLRVLSLNAKGLQDPQKVTRLKWYLSQIEFDILFFQSIKSDFSLVDVFRTLHPTRRVYSFSAQGVSTRLDRFYLSSTVVGCVRSTSLIPCTITDHRIVELTFDDTLFST